MRFAADLYGQMIAACFTGSFGLGGNLAMAVPQRGGEGSEVR